MILYNYNYTILFLQSDPIQHWAPVFGLEMSNFYAHAVNYNCIFKRHQWPIQNLTMKTCSFLDPVTSKFLLIVNVKCELPWCIWKTKPLMPCPGYFPFFTADFFLRYWICAYTGRYKPKTKRVCTFFKSSGSIYFLHKQLSWKELHKDAAESRNVRLTYASNATAFSKTKRS